jgi:hypothetical protein
VIDINVESGACGTAAHNSASVFTENRAGFTHIWPVMHRNEVHSANDDADTPVGGNVDTIDAIENFGFELVQGMLETLIHGEHTSDNSTLRDDDAHASTAPLVLLRSDSHSSDVVVSAVVDDLLASLAADEDSAENACVEQHSTTLPRSAIDGVLYAVQSEIGGADAGTHHKADNGDVNHGRGGAMHNDIYSSLRGRGRGRSHALNNTAYTAWMAHGTGHNTLANSAYAWIDGGDEANPNEALYMDVSPDPYSSCGTTALQTHRSDTTTISTHGDDVVASHANTMTHFASAPNVDESDDPLYAVPIRFDTTSSGASGSTNYGVGRYVDDDGGVDVGTISAIRAGDAKSRIGETSARPFKKATEHYVSEEPLYIDSTILALMEMESDDDNSSNNNEVDADDTYE